MSSRSRVVGVGVLEHLHYSNGDTFDAGSQDTYYLTGKVNFRHK